MFFLTFMVYMDRVNLSVATPAIMKEFHFTKMHIISAVSSPPRSPAG
jgi:ACS family glucarate transporter-like MFS transporter